ncbi:MAG: aminoacyl-histidine dipeptidase [Deltaproteobacteria bacterium]|nr:aminoacyl-histidine dipeptidase [Deltaproteobacteria bacterium]
MSSAFDGLKPELLFGYFEALTKIPRCSKNETQVAKWVVDLAKSKGLEVDQDEFGNVVVRIPPTAGKEKAATIVLQGHLDMVGEKDSSSSHDFDKDPIKVLKEGNYLTADGTTLGADNAVGLAAGLALIDEKDAVHGPLELLFTIDEETGLTGAQGLQAGFVKGKIMLNLDSEEEGSVYVGCAGGGDTHVTLPVKRAPREGDAFAVHVKGLKGGHSGLDINFGRGNAIKILATFLDRLRGESDYGLVSFEAGDKHNAIPREATATILLPADGKAQANKILDQLRSDLTACFGTSDSGVAIEMSSSQAGSDALSKESRDRLVCLVLAMPHGVIEMSQDVAGLVETSTNLAVVKLESDKAVYQESTRSSVMPALRMAQDSLFALAHLAGAKPESMGGYPGWQPNMDSKVLTRAKIVHEKVTGKIPEVKAIHAGLECGIIGEKFGGMDMLSFGPDIESPHSPSERVKIDSVERFYDFLKALLEDLAS